MKLNTLFSPKAPLIAMIFIWYYRIFGITFGGLVTKSGEFIVNRKLKLWGNIFTIFIIIIYLVSSAIIFGIRVSYQLYDSGFIISYYSITICREIKDLLVAMNLYYYQFNGFHLFELLMKYKLTKTRYNLFLLLLFTLQFLAQGFYAFTYFKMGAIFLNVLFTVILNIFGIMTISVIHFITWGKKVILLF
jgi:hypothetical protein